MAYPQRGIQAPWKTGENLTIEPFVVKLPRFEIAPNSWRGLIFHEERCRGLVYVLLVDPDTFDCMANPQPGLQAPWETGENLTIEPFVVKLPDLKVLPTAGGVLSMSYT